MKEEDMTEDNNQTQQLLGRLEVKMDNAEKSTNKLEIQINESARRQEQKIDAVADRMTTLEIKVNSLEVAQPEKEQKSSRWQIAGTIASFILAFGTIVTIAVIVIPRFANP